MFRALRSALTMSRGFSTSLMARAELMVTALLRTSAAIAGSCCNALSAPEARGLRTVAVDDSWFVAVEAAPGPPAASSRLLKPAKQSR